MQTATNSGNNHERFDTTSAPMKEQEQIPCHFSPVFHDEGNEQKLEETMLQRKNKQRKHIIF
jgi:hypothetical protein